jgi:hypothetical protein
MQLRVRANMPAGQSLLWDSVLALESLDDFNEFEFSHFLPFPHRFLASFLAASDRSSRVSFPHRLRDALRWRLRMWALTALFTLASRCLGDGGAGRVDSLLVEGGVPVPNLELRVRLTDQTAQRLQQFRGGGD